MHQNSLGKLLQTVQCCKLPYTNCFLILNGKMSLFQRVNNMSRLFQNNFHRLPKNNIIVEPVMRDVGPAVGFVVAQMAKIHPDEPLALLWGSDHLVKKEALFRKMLKTAEKQILDEPNKIIYVGQKPRFANQNLGYIEFGNLIKTVDDFPFYEFKGFQYRPPLDKAKEFSTDGKHAWNLGYFVTTPRFLWKLFEEFSPELFKKLEKIQNAYGTNDYEKVLNEVYPTLEKISFDDAILSKMDQKDAMLFPLILNGVISVRGKL